MTASRASERALLLDLDGTLADSVAALYDVYGRFMAAKGRPSNRAEFDGLNGPPLQDVVATLARRHALCEPVGDLVSEYEASLGAALCEVAPAPGADELLSLARSRGRRVAVVTSGESNRATAWLESTGLADAVDAVVGGDSVARGKPDPEPYCRALQLLQADAGASLAIEDSLLGARSAIAAGVPTYVVRAEPPQPRWPGVAGYVARLSELRALLDDA